MHHNRSGGAVKGYSVALRFACCSILIERDRFTVHLDLRHIILVDVELSVLSFVS